MPLCIFATFVMHITHQLQEQIKNIGKELGLEMGEVELTHPPQLSMGDYATNAAMIAAKKVGKNPKELAEAIIGKWQMANGKWVEKVEVAGPGFINIFLKQEYFLEQLQELLKDDNKISLSTSVTGRKVMVEYAHPNTHKEMHIGHMRTLITGEAIARLLEAGGAKVFRANYQGDIGPHVAKAIYGVKRLFERENITLDEAKTWDNIRKARFLGEAYALGNAEYDEHKEEIDGINTELYSVISSDSERSQGISLRQPADRNDRVELYLETRQWSLDYYDDFYKRFHTHFDRLFFESEMAEPGKRIVEENVGRVFAQENGALIFKGEEYGLHTRVFVTQAGHPTYEAKDMANAFKQYETFPFDRNIHVVANEQAGYFQVIIKALELLDPEKFTDSEYHLSMGMVQLSDRKISSRTGDVLTVDWLLDEVKKTVNELMAEGRIEADAKETVTEQITIGAVKHSVLKVGTAQNVAFDIKTSVSLEGNSGPYLQYTYARTQSVLRKAEISNFKFPISNFKWEPEEESLLKLLVRFNEVVTEAAENLSPNTVTTYLFELAQTFNLFYQKHSILNPVISKEERLRNPMGSLTDVRDDNTDEIRTFRLVLTQATGKVLKQGLYLLGIEAPEKM
jgi:arginyl-tRNA synthetase